MFLLWRNRTRIEANKAHVKAEQAFSQSFHTKTMKFGQSFSPSDIDAIVNAIEEWGNWPVDIEGIGRMGEVLNSTLGTDTDRLATHPKRLPDPLFKHNIWDVTSRVITDAINLAIQVRKSKNPEYQNDSEEADSV